MDILNPTLKRTRRPITILSLFNGLMVLRRVGNVIALKVSKASLPPHDYDHFYFDPHSINFDSRYFQN